MHSAPTFCIRILTGACTLVKPATPCPATHTRIVGTLFIVPVDHMLWSCYVYLLGCGKVCCCKCYNDVSQLQMRSSQPRQHFQSAEHATTLSRLVKRRRQHKRRRRLMQPVLLALKMSSTLKPRSVMWCAPLTCCTSLFRSTLPRSQTVCCISSMRCNPHPNHVRSALQHTPHTLSAPRFLAVLY